MNPQHFTDRRHNNHFKLRRTYLRRKAPSWGMLWVDDRTYFFRPKRPMQYVIPIFYKRTK
jgi:hypothetical protein